MHTYVCIYVCKFVDFLLFFTKLKNNYIMYFL